MKKTYSDDRFWTNISPFLFNSGRKKRATEEVEGMIGLMNLGLNQKICDLCCGTGRHSIEFARRGYRVTGVDFTKAYIDEARQNADEYGVDIEFIVDDMRKFIRPKYFNGIINCFTSFGFFEDRKEDLKILENIYNSLVSDGVFLIELMGKEILASIYSEKRWYEEDGVLYLEDSQIIENWKFIDMNWIIIDENKKYDYQMKLKLYSAVELELLMQEVGFKKIEFYGNFYGDDYNTDAEKLIAIAHK